jgi:hypothetical protein
MTDSIKPFDDGKGNGFTHPDKALEDLENYTPEKRAEPKKIVSPEGVFIEKLHPGYRMHNINYARGLWNIDWGVSLFAQGTEQYTQDEWIALTKQHKGDAVLPDLPLYHACITALYNNKDHPDPEQKALVEKVKNMFNEHLKSNVVMTSTRVFSDPEGKDVIAHCHGYDFARGKLANIKDKTGSVSPKSGLEGAAKVLFESKDIAEVCDVYNWAFESVVVLGAYEATDDNTWPLTLCILSKSLLIKPATRKYSGCAHVVVRHSAAENEPDN